MLDLLNKLQLILANCVRDIDAYIAKQAPLDGGGYLLNRTPYLHSEKSTDRWTVAAAILFQWAAYLPSCAICASNS
jgi:hypothetical protein